MKIYTKNQIKLALDIPFLIEEIEKGLCLASQGKVFNAPVSFIRFDSPQADVHIKSGALLEGDIYVVKIASGFYENSLLGLPTSNGVMLLFCQKTGQLLSILLEEGSLTNLRTGLAGAIAAKYLAPHPITQIGILGTGTQAKEQLLYLSYVTSCKNVLIWGRDPLKAKKFALDPCFQEFHIRIAETIEEITQSCNLIVTTTPSSTPLLFGNQLQPGTHITAIGADEVGKQELDTTVFERADLVIVDNLTQCSQYGDLSHAKNIDLSSVVELGQWMQQGSQRDPDWITVADLTGLAIEDLQIAKAVYLKLCS